jgi:hypothetical protein
MNIVEQLERIKYIDFLITSKTASSVCEISVKLKLSDRQVVNTIKLMKTLGAPIKYCKRQKLYIYLEDKKFIYKYE